MNTLCYQSIFTELAVKKQELQRYSKSFIWVKYHNSCVLSCSLTLFQAGQGRFDPQHHTYVCSFYSNRDRLTKIGDFVSLTIWLVPEKPFLKFLLQNFWKIEHLNFWASSSMSRKLKILKKKSFFAEILIFSCWIHIVHVLSFLLRYLTLL